MKYALYATPLLFFAAAASADHATDPGSPLALLAHERVRKELKLTERQSGLKSLAAKVNQGDAKVEDAVNTVKKELNAEQHGRLKEISYQVRGGAALTDAEVAQGLKLTRQQSDKLTETWAAEEKTLKDFLARARFASAEAMRKYISDHRKKAAEKMIGVLSDEQKKAFTRMQGRAFDTDGLDRD